MMWFEMRVKCEISIGISVMTSKDSKMCNKSEANERKKRWFQSCAHTEAVHVSKCMSNEHAIDIFVRLFNHATFLVASSLQT